MALKLKDFARTNIESDPIRRSDESEDEDISYLPTPSSGNMLHIFNIFTAQRIFPHLLTKDLEVVLSQIVQLKLCFSWNLLHE